MRLSIPKLILTVIAFVAVICILRFITVGSSESSDRNRFEWRIVATDAARLGTSVALDGKTLVVGAPQSKIARASGGYAFVLSVDSNQEQQLLRLSSDDNPSTVEFGASVAVSCRFAIVGAPPNDIGESSGTAYVFERDEHGNWIHTAKLQASDGAGSERFGAAVAIHNDLALVGTCGRDFSGAVYVFEHLDDQWRQIEKPTSGANPPYDLFGWPLAIHNRCAVVGAHADQGAGRCSGAAYVFQRDESGRWNLETKLSPNQPGENGHGGFGRALAIGDGTILVGAPGEEAAYVFKKDDSESWRQVARLTSQRAAGDFWFGSAVAISGRTIAVGSPLENDAVGAVYLFQARGNGTWQGWQPVGKLASDSLAPGRFFGRSLAMNSELLVVGASPYVSGNPSTPGSVYLYRLAPTSY